MCGISGIFNLPTSTMTGIDENILRQINNAQAHRGPDDQGYHIAEQVGLGHRRLSIIDLEGGHQPIYNDNKQTVVVFNGEIYNYREVASELQEKGYQFQTESDTETIVHAWDEWGPNCIEHFRGMFAFAIWDNQKQTLFLVRDRLGIKPLHYSVLSNGQLIFGSELKALKQHPLFDHGLNPEAIEDYLTLGYVPDPKCIYRNTFKLEAGHYILIEPQTKGITPKQYWDLPLQPVKDNQSYNLENELIERLEEAVKYRMVSEVPIGSFLSGGVDSSAVVSLMASLQKDPITTCAIGFDVPKYNESDFAQLVADKYNTNHHLKIVDHNDFELIDKLTKLYDEPYADSSALPTYRVCQLAREHVTVCLSGDGGDELFAGYRRYKMHAGEEKVRQIIPRSLRKAIFKPLGRIYPKMDWAPRFLRAKTTLQSIGMSAPEGYLNSMSKLRLDQRESLYSTNFKTQLNGYRSSQLFDNLVKGKTFTDPIKQIQYIDFKTWLTGDILTKVDRASMAHSLEVRVPILDHKFVEWAFNIPSQLNMKSGEGKAGFKKALEPLVPFENLYRDKMGFSIPLAEWLRGPLKSKLENTINNPKLMDLDIFNHKKLLKMVREHEKGISDHSAALWTILMLGQFIEQQG